MPTLIIEYKNGEVKRHTGFVSPTSNLIRIDLGEGTKKYLPVDSVVSIIQIDGDGVSATAHEKKIKEMVREMLAGKPEEKICGKMKFSVECGPENNIYDENSNVIDRQSFPSVTNTSN